MAIAVASQLAGARPQAHPVEHAGRPGCLNRGGFFYLKWKTTI